MRKNSATGFPHSSEALPPRARASRFAELAALYGLAPLGAYALIHWAGVPLIAVLAPVLALFILALGLDATFSWRALLVRLPAWGVVRRIAVMFCALGAAITAFAYFGAPELFLSFPRQRPGLWLFVMVFYPLVSVTAQELMYRVFFAHRYAGLFGRHLPWMVVVNAGLFAYSHLIFESWLAIAASFAGGLIFAYRYFATGSFWAVCLEHALYGNLIFTVGLGRHLLAGLPFE